MMQYNYRRKKLMFSRIELRDLGKSLFAIALAFTFAQVGLQAFNTNFIVVFLVSLFTVGIGFALHELAHKYFAQRYHCWAEYRSDDKMLIMAVLISFLGVVFAAPGAVMIHGHLTRKQHGIISASGPATNVVLAAIFLAIGIAGGGIIQIIGFAGATINSWLAVFNMIPAWQFDGAKVWRWDKTAYGVIMGAALLLMAITILF